MGDCINTEIRDALPDLIHERLGANERARTEAHVAACSDCSAEVALIRRAAAVLALGAPRMDARRIAAALPASRGRADRPQPIFGRPRLYQLAAAIVLVVLGAGLIRMTLQSGSDVDPLITRGPTAVVMPASGIAMVGGIESLTSDDLATLVAGVESLEAVPATEPEPLQLTSYDLGQGEAQ
jgi:anti-sigma factor RsiW